MNLYVPSYDPPQISSTLAAPKKKLIKFFVSPEKCENQRYEVLTPERRLDDDQHPASLRQCNPASLRRRLDPFRTHLLAD